MVLSVDLSRNVSPQHLSWFELYFSDRPPIRTTGGNCTRPWLKTNALLELKKASNLRRLFRRQQTSSQILHNSAFVSTPQARSTFSHEPGSTTTSSLYSCSMPIHKLTWSSIRSFQTPASLQPNSSPPSWLRLFLYSPE